MKRHQGSGHSLLLDNKISKEFWGGGDEYWCVECGQMKRQTEAKVRCIYGRLSLYKSSFPVANGPSRFIIEL